MDWIKIFERSESVLLWALQLLKMLPWIPTSLLFLCFVFLFPTHCRTLFCSACDINIEHMSSGIFVPGQLMLGGLFPLHRRANIAPLNPKVGPQPDVCVE